MQNSADMIFTGKYGNMNFRIKITSLRSFSPVGLLVLCFGAFMLIPWFIVLDLLFLSGFCRKISSIPFFCFSIFSPPLVIFCQH